MDADRAALAAALRGYQTPDLMPLLKAGASGLGGAIAGIPVDTTVNAANLARALYGYTGNKLGLLSAEQMPEPIDPASVAGSSASIHNMLGVGDSGPEQAAEFIGGMLAPGPKGSAATKMEAIGPKKQALIDAGYYHEIGGGKKLQRPIDEMTHERVANTPMADRVVISPESLQGGVLVPATGDRSAAGELLTSVSGRRLEVPVQLEGGPDFMRTHAASGSAWAADKGVISSLARITREAGEGGRPVYMPNVAMGHTSGDFSTMMSDALLEQVRVSKIPKKAINDFDADVRKSRPEFLGINHPDVRKQLEGNGALRAVFVDRMKLDPYVEAGFPNIAETRWAISDPTMRHDPLHSSGRTIAKLDSSGRVISNPVQPHSTYNTQLGGEYMGGLVQPVPRETMFPDFHASRRASGKDPAGDARSFQLGNPTQDANQQWLDGVMKWLEGR